MMREWIIALDKKTGLIKVLNIKDYLESGDKYAAIDDSSTEYKAHIKAKEIVSMGVSRYEELRTNKLVSEAMRGAP